MVSTQNFEIKLQELFKQKQYSTIIFEIISQTQDKERPASLCNLLGLSRIYNNNKNKESLSVALKDFKQGYLKETNTNYAIDCLANFITSSVLLIDLEKNYKFDFSEIINFYELSEKFCINHRSINLAMAWFIEG